MMRFEIDSHINVRHRNPGASADLVIPIELTLNTADEVIAANVHANSRRSGTGKAGRLVRIKTTEPHDRIAVICGSGPSMADTLGAVQMRGPLCDVFALNGAASYLSGHGVVPDYQVMVDAREVTADLIGPARVHLFASQVHPKCFDIVPDAILWHFDNGGMADQLPEDEEAHALIGGAGSVGNCSLALAWAMGYRTFEIHGMDSSHRDGRGHAFHQEANTQEPFGRFEFNGKQYICSYTMRSQASRFQLVGRALLNAGCIVNVHGSGLLQDMWRENCRIHDSGTVDEREELKYQMMWAVPQYRDHSPGETLVSDIIAMLNMPEGASVADWGCGPGRLTKRLIDEGFDAFGFDIASNCLDEHVRVPLHVGSLWAIPEHISAEYGVCCDVMEHIPPEKVDAVLANIRAHTRRRVYFAIADFHDAFGAEIGEHLHLTVQPHEWWAEQLAQHWPVVRQSGPPGTFIVDTQENAA